MVGALLLMVAGALPAAAQESRGQFCVRSYEDVNANGVFDTESERLITRGVGVELIDNTGVVVSSALLDKSPNASSGIICFYNLSEGDYSALMSSADYIATTERLVPQSVSNTAPTIIEFGARRLGSESIATPLVTNSGGSLMSPVRIAAATISAAVIMVVFLLTGFLVYGMRSNRPAAQPVNYSPDSIRQFEPPADTGSMQPVQTIPPQYATPPTGQQSIVEPPVSDEDTNPVKPS